MLKAEGGTLADIIHITVYEANLERLMEIHEVRHRCFGDVLPASRLVQVITLGQPELTVEIEAIASSVSRSVSFRGGTTRNLAASPRGA